MLHDVAADRRAPIGITRVSSCLTLQERATCEWLCTVACRLPHYQLRLGTIVHTPLLLPLLLLSLRFKDMEACLRTTSSCTRLDGDFLPEWVIDNSN